MTARSLEAPLLALLLFVLSPAIALADEPYVPPTPEEAAAEQAKQALADAVGVYAATGVWDLVQLGSVAPEYCTEASGVSCAPPEPGKTLAVWARRQINGTYCGPAATQAVINFTRSVFDSTLDGEDPGRNWIVQSIIGNGMGTDSGGSSSYAIRNYLNGRKANGGAVDSAKRPAGFTWSRSVNDNGQQMYNRIVTVIANWSMPAVLAVDPHRPGQVPPEEYYLPSWPNPYSTTGHFIAIRGYSGDWDGTDTGAHVNYVDSSGNGGLDPGRYVAGARTMWEVNKKNGRTIVW